MRQHPFIYRPGKNSEAYFIADFYCAEKKLVIELDGEIHRQQKEYDNNRDEILNGMGIEVIRFKNEDVEKAIEFVKGLTP